MLCNNYCIIVFVFIHNFQIKLAKFLKTSFSVGITFADKIGTIDRLNDFSFGNLSLFQF